MAIVSNVTRRAEIPHEPGEWVEIRRLSWRQLEKASDLQTNASLARMRALGGDLLGALRSSSSQQQADPAASYDRAFVLNAGIVRWSYDVPVSPESIDLLDEETAAWVFREILALHKPRTEEEQKNGSSPSTSA